MSKKTNKRANPQGMERYRKQMVQFLCHLIRIPSVKGTPTPKAPFGRIPLETLNVFLSNAREQEFRTATLGGKVGYLEFGPEKGPLIAAVCHLDVVPAGHWQTAFSPVVTETEVIGRGAADNKGPAAAVFYAMKALKDDGFRPRCRIRLILGLDEETDCACMAHYREHAELPVAAFTPDADFPVISAEKGIVHFQIRYTEPEVLTSPDGLRLAQMTGGTKVNVVPELSRYDLRSAAKERRTHTVNGRAAHAATPQEGFNAISMAMRELQEKGFRSSLIDWYNRAIGYETDGRSLGIQTADEPSGALTFNVGLVEFDGTDWIFTCDLRYPVTADGKQIMKQLETQVSEFGGRLDPEHVEHMPPLHLPPEHTLIRTLMAVYNEQTGDQAKPIGFGGGTYARTLPNTVAFGAVFPNESSNMHQAGEKINIDSLVKASEIYYHTFIRLDQVYGSIDD